MFGLLAAACSTESKILLTMDSLKICWTRILSCPERLTQPESSSSPTTAFDFNYAKGDPLKMQLADICVVPANIAGLPAISMPCGYDSKNLPIGLQIVGKQWSDGLIFNVANMYERENFCAKIIGGVQYEI